jgi:7,8-dihydropterin-6-yl-methyl-4-(beta-D-ribofuranosyl)aminobenzene 5'-phosphate synthase
LEERSFIDSCKITVLVEDTADEKSGFTCKHGLSLLIEATKRKKRLKALFDVGPSSQAIEHNMKKLNLKLNDLNVIVISHGHYDHVDGLLKVLNLVEKPVPVLIHPKAFNPKFAYKPHLTYIGAKFNRLNIEASGGVLASSTTPIALTDGVATSGEIPLETGFEKPKGFWKVEDDRFVEDLMVDEQAVIVNLPEGLAVIVGCSHRGVVNTIQHAQRIMNRKEVYAIIGGFHLLKASDGTIRETVDQLEKISPEHVYPCHCTGRRAVNRLGLAFGDGCKQVRAGDVVTLR